MALAHLTINLDAFTGDDRPPVSQYSTITLDPGVDHIDAANDVIHVRSIVVSLDRQGKAATANGVPCVDGRVPVVAGVAYAVSAPNILRGGPHYIPALTAAQVVDLSDYITPGAPLTPDQAATLTARIVALEAGGGGGGGGVTVHNLLTGRSTADAHPTSAITGLDAALTGKASTTHGHVIADTTGLQATLDAKAATSHTHTGVYAPALGADDNYVTGAEKAALHTHPAVIAQGATQADARTAIGAGTSSIVVGTGAGDAKAGNYQPTAANVSDSTTTGRALLTAADAAAARTALGLGTAATTAATAYATAAQGTLADSALAASAAPELIRDTMATALVAGANVTITPNDGADTITIAASGGGGGVVPPEPFIIPPGVGQYLPVLAYGGHYTFPCTGGRSYPCPQYAHEAMNVDAVGVMVDTGVGGVTIELALYTWGGGITSTLVSTLGSVDASSAGLKVLTFTPLSLAAGLHLIVARSSTNVSVRGVSGGTMVQDGPPDAGSNRFRFPHHAAASLPSSITWDYGAGVYGNNFPKFQMRRSA
jgi:hypothetical protein